MKLIIKCEKCRSEIDLPHRAYSRVVYAHKYGEDFKLRCISCNDERIYEVDDIRAVDYNFIELIKNSILVYAAILAIAISIHVFLLSAVPAGVFLYLFPWVALAFMKKNNSSKTLTFNKIKYKSRMTSIGQG